MLVVILSLRLASFHALVSSLALAPSSRRITYLPVGARCLLSFSSATAISIMVMLSLVKVSIEALSTQLESDLFSGPYRGSGPICSLVEGDDKAYELCCSHYDCFTPCDKEDFEKAAKDALTLPATTTDEDKLILYGLYKTATVGKVNTSRPGIFDPKGKYKWDAWKAVEGKSKEEAMKDYITKVTQLKEA